MWKEISWFTVVSDKYNSQSQGGAMSTPVTLSRGLQCSALCAPPLRRRCCWGSEPGVPATYVKNGRCTIHKGHAHVVIATEKLGTWSWHRCMSAGRDVQLSEGVAAADRR